MFRTGRPKDQGPEPVDFTETLSTEFCPFPVRYEASGKTKTIELPNGDRLFKNDGTRVTLTNLENGKQETFVVTGTIRATELEGGDLQLVSTGQTLFSSPNIGLLRLTGRFTVVEDEEGNLSQPKGDGSIIDVCAQLA
jgi:hypothetical protein